MNKPIVVEETYNSSPEIVWKALTIKSKMKEWYFDIDDFVLEKGAIFNFYEPGDAKAYHHQCKIKEIVENNKLEHTWTHPSHSKGESLLTWEIFPEGTKTRVRLTHNFIENFADAGKDFERENYEVGWKEILGQSLKAYLEK